VISARTIARFAAAIAICMAGGSVSSANAAGGTGEHRAADSEHLSFMAQLGARMFFDRSLSASGRMSCASCHDPRNAYAPNNRLPVQLGGPHLDLQGLRAVPSLQYMTMTPPFSIGPESLQEVDPKVAAPALGPLAGAHRNTPKAGAVSAVALVPQGGFFRDGRADTLQEQSIVPLLSPFEMDNATMDIVRDKLMRAPYASRFKTLFGPDIFADKNMVLSEAAFAIARYETENANFHPFTSQYDFYLRGKAKLSASAARGLKLFDDPKKGNCASCHLDKITADGQPPAFTDYQYEALGAPRNHAIAANRNPLFFDLGICGPLRSDSYAKQAANCGLFKTPTLRNVATRHGFFHNGFFKTLRDVLRFYVERDTNPEKWYPRRPDGTVEKFDDVPQRYRANIDVIDAPLDRKAGEQPALNAAEIDDTIAFLDTLTDGYKGHSIPIARKR
jgi:cytochrome c peroxidase